MRLLIVDDHQVLWAGLRNLVERCARQREPEGIFDWHASRQVESLVHDVGAMQDFDLILLDYHLPGLCGVEAMRVLRARYESALIVIISADEQPRRIRDAIEGGAAGYVLKTMPEPEMQAALALVLARGIYLPPVALFDADPEQPTGGPGVRNGALRNFMTAALSPRQRDVFARALQGKPNKVIARELGIAEGTVKVHLAMVYRELGVRNRTEAMYRVLSADAADVVARL